VAGYELDDRGSDFFTVMSMAVWDAPSSIVTDHRSLFLGMVNWHKVEADQPPLNTVEI